MHIRKCDMRWINLEETSQINNRSVRRLSYGLSYLPVATFFVADYLFKLFLLLGLSQLRICFENSYYAFENCYILCYACLQQSGNQFQENFIEHSSIWLRVIM